MFVFTAGERQLDGKVQPGSGWGERQGEGQVRWCDWSLGSALTFSTTPGVQPSPAAMGASHVPHQGVCPSSGTARSPGPAMRSCRLTCCCSGWGGGAGGLLPSPSRGPGAAWVKQEPAGRRSSACPGNALAPFPESGAGCLFAAAPLRSGATVTGSGNAGGREAGRLGMCL